MERDDTDSATATERARAGESSSRRRSRRWPIVSLVVGIAVGLALVPAAPVIAAGGASSAAVATDATIPTTAEGSLVVTDATVEPDETVSHRLTLTDAPDGLAGFGITLELAGDDATISNASYPDEYEKTTDPIVSDDGRSVTVEAADLTDEVTPDAANVTLATVEVNATATGSTTLRVTDAQVDADDGSRVDPGALTVDEDGPAAGSSQTEEGATASDGSDSVPGFAAGSAIAAIAVLAAALLARSR